MIKKPVAVRVDRPCGNVTACSQGFYKNSKYLLVKLSPEACRRTIIVEGLVQFWMYIRIQLYSFVKIHVFRPYDIITLRGRSWWVSSFSEVVKMQHKFKKQILEMFLKYEYFILLKMEQDTYSTLSKLSFPIPCDSEAVGWSTTLEPQWSTPPTNFYRCGAGVKWGPRQVPWPSCPQGTLVWLCFGTIRRDYFIVIAIAFFLNKNPWLFYDSFIIVDPTGFLNP